MPIPPLSQWASDSGTNASGQTVRVRQFNVGNWTQANIDNLLGELRQQGIPSVARFSESKGTMVVQIQGDGVSTLENLERAAFARSAVSGQSNNDTQARAFSGQQEAAVPQRPSLGDVFGGMFGSKPAPPSDAIYINYQRGKQSSFADVQPASGMNISVGRRGGPEYYVCMDLGNASEAEFHRALGFMAAQGFQEGGHMIHDGHIAFTSMTTDPSKVNGIVAQARQLNVPVDMSDRIATALRSAPTPARAVTSPAAPTEQIRASNTQQTTGGVARDWVLVGDKSAPSAYIYRDAMSPSEQSALTADLNRQRIPFSFHDTGLGANLGSTRPVIRVDGAANLTALTNAGATKASDVPSPMRQTSATSSPEGSASARPAGSNLRYTPQNYGGDARFDAGNGWSAFADSGGVRKYGGVNEDRVALGSSDLGSSPLKAQAKMLQQAVQATDAIRNGGSTISMATWQDGKIFTTHLGDSPVWVMEQTRSGKVIPHLINANFHNPNPFETNVIGKNLGDGFGQKAVKELGTKPQDFQNVADFSKQMRNGSKFFVLAGSDGLLDHTGAIDRGLEYPESSRQGNREVDQQVAEAGKRYAQIFEDHLRAVGSVSDPSLAIRVNDAATQMHVAKKIGDKPEIAGQYRQSPSGKDNTSFVIAEAQPGKEITVVVADGNGPVGEQTSTAAVKAATNGFVTKVQTLGLDRPNSAAAAFQREAASPAPARGSSGGERSPGASSAGGSPSIGQRIKTFFGNGANASLDGDGASAETTPANDMTVGHVEVIPNQSNGAAKPALNTDVALTTPYKPTIRTQYENDADGVAHIKPKAADPVVASTPAAPANKINAATVGKASSSALTSVAANDAGTSTVVSPAVVAPTASAMGGATIVTPPIGVDAAAANTVTRANAIAAAEAGDAAHAATVRVINPTSDMVAGASDLSQLGHAGGVLLAAPTVLEAGSAGYDAWKKGGNAEQIAGATAQGAGNGLVDTYLPGARTGYADVVGKQDLTPVDRFLKGLDHASGTVTSVGATAMLVEAPSVAAGGSGLAAETPTAVVTGGAGIVNFADNGAQALLKVTGLSGRDADGGYIYTGGHALLTDSQMRAAVPATDVHKLLDMLPAEGQPRASGDAKIDAMIQLKQQILNPATPQAERHASQITLDYDARQYFVDTAHEAFKHSGLPKTNDALDQFTRDALAHHSNGAFAAADAAVKKSQPAPAAHATPVDPAMAKIQAEKTSLTRYENDLQALEMARNGHMGLDPKVLAELRTLPAQLKQMETEIKGEYKDLQTQIAHNPKLAQALEEVCAGLTSVTMQMHQDAKGFGWNGSMQFGGEQQMVQAFESGLNATANAAKKPVQPQR